MLCLSDCSLLPLLLARANIPSLSHLFAVESSKHCRAVITEVSLCRHLNGGKIMWRLKHSLHKTKGAEMLQN